MNEQLNEQLNKQGQLAAVVVGFFATIQVLVVESANAAAPSVRILLTLAVALACAVRYWWVILLLPWPFRWMRLVLILLAWSAVPFIAASSGDARHWAFALAGLSLIGAATEVYNGLTGQWRVGSEAMTHSLERDHVNGAVAAGSAAAILVWAGATLGATRVQWIVLALVAADWARLILMIRRHQSLLIPDHRA